MIEILKISLIAFVVAALIQRKQSMLSWYGKLIKKLPWYLYFPLGGCYLCFVGEFCLWYYIVTKKFVFELDYFTELGFFILAGIFISMVYHKIYCWLNA
jgi:hypothetical protein